MDTKAKRPLLEVLSWIAGIVGTLIAAYAMFGQSPPRPEPSSKTVTHPSGSAPIPSAPQAPVALNQPLPQPSTVRDSPVVQFPRGDFAKAMSSRHGELVVSSAMLSSSGKTQAVLNGVDLPDAESLGYIVSITAALAWRDKTAFLVGGSNGGSCCPWDVYSLVVVDSAGKYRLIQNDRFLGNLSRESISVRGDEIAFDLGFQRKKRTVALFDGSRVRIEETYTPGETLSSDQCDWLYDDALGDCERNSPPCPDSPQTGYAMRGYLALRNDHPGINGLEFERFCQATCMKKQRPNKQEFRDAVCRLK